MKLVDKAAVVAEIERRIKTKKECMLGLRNLDYYQGKVDALNDTISFLNTLEVKEVDFEDSKSVFEGQYLSKDKVVTTIERLQDECEEQGDNNGVELLEKLFNKLDHLEVKEVDLEKEIEYKIQELTYSSNYTKKYFREIAKHFFELGIKAKKNEG